MDRLQLLLMPAKHQPDLIYLRHVPLRRVHLFTFIQVCVVTRSDVQYSMYVIHYKCVYVVRRCCVWLSCGC